MKRLKPITTESNQPELFAVLFWKSRNRPFRLHAGDVVKYENRLCHVLRVNECSAVLLMNQSSREFKTRFDKAVRFQRPPVIVRISPDSNLSIFNR